MSIKMLAILSASALAMAACSKPADTGNTVIANTTADASLTNDVVAANDTAVASPAQIFVNAVAASDAYETATSKLALEKGASSAVKKYANEMIVAHAESTAKLKKTVGTLATPLTPDPALNAEQQAKLDALTSKSGADFDTAYVADQQAGHQQTLDTLRGYSGTGDVAELKAFATGLTPIVAAHLNMSKGLKP